MQVQAIDEQDIIDYIYTQLTLAGYAVQEQEIAMILNLEMEFMIETGHAIMLDDDDSYYDPYDNNPNDKNDDTDHTAYNGYY